MSSVPDAPVAGQAHRELEVAEALGVSEVRLRRVQGGASREAYLVESASGEGIAFLRADGVDGVVDGAVVPLSREADVLRLMRDLRFPVPTVLAVFAEPAALLMNLLPGTSRPPADQVERVAPAYMALLARLHRLDPSAVGLPVPDSVTTSLLTAVAALRRDALGTGVIDRPMIRLALRLLEEMLPRDPAVPVPVHGDAGPGNFMVHDGAITGLVDWELFHLGDPHEDLAWVWMRGAHTDFGDFSRRLAEYEAAAGRRMDPRRLEWQLVLVMTTSVIALWSGIVTMRSGGDALSPWVAALAYEALLGAALARLQGGSLRLLDHQAVARDTAEVSLVNQLAASLDAGAARSAVVIVDQLRREAAYRDWMADALEADLSTLSNLPGEGRPVASELVSLVDSAAAGELLVLTIVIGRAADRAVLTQPRSERIVRRAQTIGMGV